MLIAERNSRCCDFINETNVATGGRIVLGEPSSPVSTIIHIFPHTGFSPADLERAKKEHPEADTLLASISRVKEGDALIGKAKELGSELYYR